MSAKNVVTVPVTLGAASLSGALDFGERVLVGISYPSGWETATVVSFQAAPVAGGTFADVYDSGGTEVTAHAGASVYTELDPDLLVGLKHVKVRSGTTAAPVEQTCTIWLTLREV